MSNNVSFGSQAGVNLYGAAREFKKAIQDGSVGSVNKSTLQETSRLVGEAMEIKDSVRFNRPTEREQPYESAKSKPFSLLENLQRELQNFNAKMLSGQADTKDKDWLSQAVIMLTDKNPIIQPDPFFDGASVIEEKPTNGFIELGDSIAVDESDDDGWNSYPAGTRYAVFASDDIDY